MHGYDYGKRILEQNEDTFIYIYFFTLYILSSSITKKNCLKGCKGVKTR